MVGKAARVQPFVTTQITSFNKAIAKLKDIFYSKTTQWQEIIREKNLKKETAAKNPSEDRQPTKSSAHKNSAQSFSKVPVNQKFVLVLKFLLLPITHPYLRYVTLFIFALGLIAIGFLLQELPSPRRLTSSENFAVSTQIFDRNGELLYEIFADENRVPIKLEDLPPHVAQATIAIEDQNFYRHHGFDLLGIIRAVRNNIRGERLEGGSTITQQLVKNALLTRERSIERKAKEAILAVFTELLYSKDEILEMYLNYVSYGGTAVGIETAANRYFDKSAKDLDLAEAALLAGLPQAPTRYSPFGSDTTQSKQRQTDVIRRMLEDGFISKLEAEAARGQVLEFALSKTDIEAPHFVFYVRDLLYEEFGVETVEKGGLRVTTSLDLSLQKTAQASVSAEVERLTRHRVGNGAALIVKPNTGEILSMIGSKDYFNTEAEGQVNVTLAFRQPGSSIKPLMYATALQEKKLNPGSILLDIPTCFSVPGQKVYCPKNYDGTFRGPVTVRKSLGNSLNIPAVKSIRTVGVTTFIDQATQMGITTWTDPANYGLSLTLGGGEVRMIDMAQAFSVLANQGIKVPLTPILKIEDFTGKLITEINLEERQEDFISLTEFDYDGREGDLERVMDRAPAYLVSHIMQDNNARVEAFGSRSQLVIPDQVVSAKTGTTNDLKDNWTIGFTPEFLVVTWVGNNDNTPMNPFLVSGITGAAPIWNDIMSFILADQEPLWQEKPPDVASAGVCAHGLPPQRGEECKITYTELFWEKSKPSRSTVATKEIWINPETGLPLVPGESEEGLVLETRTVYQDPLTDEYCSDCSRAVTEEGEIIYEKNTVTNEYVITQQ